jgi:hypothetical protein
MLTVAFATTAPDGSMTVPEIDDEFPVCAPTTPGRRNTHKHTIKTSNDLCNPLITSSPLAIQPRDSWGYRGCGRNGFRRAELFVAGENQASIGFKERLRSGWRAGVTFPRDRVADFVRCLGRDEPAEHDRGGKFQNRRELYGGRVRDVAHLAGVVVKTVSVHVSSRVDNKDHGHDRQPDGNHPRQLALSDGMDLHRIVAISPRSMR